jgi:pimeloyl-ACP methyl ester carboxylesterase
MATAISAGKTISYEVRGDGPPLLLHVGYLGRRQDWLRVDVGIAQALEADFCLILIDPRGQGESDRSHDPADYTLERRVGDVLAVLDDLGVTQVHIWGYSMGGTIGFAPGAFAPYRLRSLILGGCNPYGLDREAVRSQAATLRGESMAEHVARIEASRGPVPAAARAVWLTLDPLALAAYWEARSAHPELDPSLPTIRVPALIYAGDRDAQHDGARRVAEMMPEATFLSLPGLNHSQAFREKEGLLPQVRAFLAGVEREGVQSDGG